MLSIMPAWIAGRNFWDLLTIYFNQAGQYHNLSKNAPNLWSFLASRQDSGLSLFGIMLAGAAVLFLLYFLWERCRTLSDLFAILYALNKPKRFPVSLLVIGASTVSYLPFLFGESPVELTTAAVLMGAALILVLWDLYRAHMRGNVK